MTKINEIRLAGKYIISSHIELVSGLHIGTSKDTMKIGDLDNPVIKDAFGKPYIPGSSLKGKMRSLMELYHNLISMDKLIYSRKDREEKRIVRLHMCGKKECKVCGLFGNAPSEQQSVIEGKKIEIEYKVPTRIIVRDARLIDESITEQMKENMDFEYTEIKFENSLDRILSTANPRQTERVPAGAKFNSEIIVNRFIIDNSDDSIDFLEQTLIAMKLLEDDYLGGQGTRGYGKIKFVNLSIEYRDIDYYSNKSKISKRKEIEQLSYLFEGGTSLRAKISDLS